MIELLTSPEAWAALVTLTALEIVLGIDNVIFLSVLVARLPEEQAKRARQIGLLLALVFRVILLFSLFWLTHLEVAVFTLFGEPFTWRDLVLIAGGLFLIYKATIEIHQDVEGGPHKVSAGPKVYASFGAIVGQIAVIDMVFSVDSILTAIGMADYIGVMIAAVVFAIAVMYVASGPVAGFIERHPTTRMLALSFLLMIGLALVADGLGFHIPRGYLYAAMGFSTLVELLNVISKRNRSKHEA
jgi:predicted tellurium resistance membrane protein TerC